MTARTPHALVVACVMTIVTLVMTWPLMLQLGTALPSDLGDPLLNTWILGWDADRIRHGLRGLWDAPNFFPHSRTLTFSEHLLGIAVIVFPIEFVTGNPILAYDVAFLLAFVVAGTGMYLLAHSLSGRHDAAFIAGLAYAFWPYRMAELSRIQVLWSGWLPVALWALHRYFDSFSRRWLLAFVASVLLQCLSNSYFVYIAAVPILFVVAYELARRRPSPQAYFSLVLAAVAIIAVMAPVGWAYYTARRDLHLVRTMSEIRRYGADIGAYFHADPSVRIWRGLPGIAMIEGDLFPGLTAIALAAAALWRWRGGPRIRVLYAAIGVCGFVLSLGPQPTAWHRVLMSTGPYAWLMSVIPGLDGLRVPARFAVVVQLSVSVLAAVGFSRVQSHFSASRQRVAAVAVALLVLIEGWGAPIPTVRLVRSPDDRAAYTALRGSAPGAVVEFPLQRAMSFSPLAYPIRDGPGFLNTRYQYETLFHGHPIVNGFSGYEPLLNVLLRRVVDERRLGEALQMLRSLGVRYAIVRPPESSAQRLRRVTVAQLTAETEQIQSASVFGTTALIELKPWIVQPAASGLRRVEMTALHLWASDRRDRLAYMLDGDLKTRWTSRYPQTGREWIRVRFAKSVNLRLVHIEHGDSITGYPRAVRIETAASDTEPPVTQYEGTIVPQFGQGLVRDPRRAPIDVVLPRNRTSILWIRQTGRTSAGRWSIHEIEFWEEPATPVTLLESTYHARNGHRPDRP
jgi:hypothetical protein